jgi:hypothetical protein
VLFRQYSFALFASALIVTGTGKASVAFTVTPSEPNATEFYREESVFNLSDNRRGRTVIDKRLWLEPLPVGGSFMFNTGLNLWSLTSELGSGGWNFLPAEEELKGSFEVVTYQACGPQDGCGGASTPISDIGEGIFRGVGALFHLKYHPELDDPLPGIGSLHWIQVIQANYGRDRPGVPGIPGIGIPEIPFVDNSGRKDSPYYDYPGYRFAGEDFFMDRPYASGINRAESPHYFDARLYLVEDITTYRQFNKNSQSS